MPEEIRKIIKMISDLQSKVADLSRLMNFHQHTKSDLTQPLPFYEFKSNIVTVTSTYTAQHNDCTILVDATSAAVTLNLPLALLAVYRNYTIKKIDSAAHNVTITPAGSEKIDGASTKVISAQYTSVRIQSDGTAWWIL